MTRSCRSTKRARAAFASDTAGATAVEFAFVLPVFLLGLFLMLEFSRVMYSKVAFDYAVFSATRFSAVAKDTTTASVQKALKDGLILLDPAKLSNVQLTTTSNGDSTSTATLRASYRVDSLLPLTNLTSITFTRNVSFLVNK